MAALTNELKRFIVQSLACYDTPSQIVLAVKQEFKIDVTRQQCEMYDPTKRAGKNLSKKWVDEFHEARTKFKEDVSDIPIANKSFRLRALNRIVDEAKGNSVLKMQALEQAAKEVGDSYTNRKEITGKGGDPLSMLVTQLQGSALPFAETVTDDD
ncbi:DUF2280 domain-containing protein [Aquirhabdus parva]|uniref:DUF2280 domain-containing protein n=1 Tax=Aquirhabdus parva TaxID=2283318 RepID=A0A345PAQ7_9GAMM|nr:DUF2280 domain-containing protein [Aquirhabdus parva]AXI04366.1 DUF2280 domain-containing protein [Aquirhabdus parva]AXI04410.1 DUF2280 domain-containing protein [Aquirhabdus parva]